jgi:putative ABC transport system permease protein
LIRQLLTESALLSLGGGILGFLLALGGVRALVNMAPPETIPRAEEIGVNFIVLGFSLGVSLLTGLIFGLAPAWHASKANLNDSFKTMGRASTAGRGAQRTRGFLVALEIAVASVLLVGAGLMIRTFVRLEAVDPGFKTENVITMQAHLPRFKYARPTGKRVGKSNDLIAITPELPIRIEQMLSKIESIAGVEIAGATSALPMTVGQGGRAFQIEGRPKLGPGERWPAANYAAVSPNYLRTMGIPLLNGRHFTESDSENAGRVAIVSKSTALRYWPGENPVGKQILIDDLTQMESTRQIVGVVGDVRTFKLDEEPGRLIYVPYAQQPRFYPHTAYHERHFVNFTIRTRMDPAPVIAMARKAIAESDPDAPVSDVRTLRQVVAAQTIRPRFYMALLSAFAGMALFLAAVGIYAVMAYSVNQRIHEIGVRMALGARRGDVLKLVLMQYSLVAVGGLSVGLAASLYLTRFISGWLYGVRATDPATLAAASFVLITAAMLGCYIPAHRAMGMDPMAALRHE